MRCKNTNVNEQIYILYLSLYEVALLLHQMCTFNFLSLIELARVNHLFEPFSFLKEDKKHSSNYARNI
jgi:hypothetical protein